MNKIKITSFNAEWMTHLFKKDLAEFWLGESGNGGIGSKPRDVQKVCERIASVINDVKPDILGIQEGPPLKEQMELFNKDYLESKFTVYSMPSGSQSIHVLARKGIVGLEIEQIKGDHKIYKHLSRKLQYYLWGDILEPKQDTFSRHPVVLKIRHISTGDEIELMTMHTKSKISQLKNPSQLRRHRSHRSETSVRARGTPIFQAIP
jgi:hypothetical protein